MTMRQAASMLGVSEAVVRRFIDQKTLPAKQIVKFAPWVIEGTDLDLPAVHRAIGLVRTGRRDAARAPNNAQTRMFSNPEEQLGEI
jgi:Helix-turn-helix domain